MHNKLHNRFAESSGVLSTIKIILKSIPPFRLFTSSDHLSKRAIGVY